MFWVFPPQLTVKYCIVIVFCAFFGSIPYKSSPVTDSWTGMHPRCNMTCLWHNSLTPHLIIPWRFFPMVGIINIFQHGFPSKTQANWWFHIFLCSSLAGEWSNLTYYFSKIGWFNHQQTLQEQCGQNLTTLRAGEVWSCKKPTWTLSNLDWMVEKRVLDQPAIYSNLSRSHPKKVV